MTTAAVELPLRARRSLAADIALALHQVRYEQRAFWRSRERAFFSFLLPVMFVFIFGSLHHHDTIGSRGGIPADAFVVPGLLAYGVIMATFTNLAVALAASRESGVLKRMRGTPLPGWAFLAGRIGSAVVTAAILSALTLIVARAAYGVDVRLETLPGLLSVLLVGTACFSALGIGINRLITRADAAPAIASVAILPLTFFSGVWGDFGGIPSWMHRLAQLFPVEHLANAMQVAFDPRTHGPGIVWTDLLVLALWCVVGVTAGVRFLRRERLSG